MQSISVLALSLFVFLCGLSAQQTPTAASAAANADPVYQQLRHVRVGEGAVSVKDFVLQRDAGKFVFHSGTFALLAPVQGKVTGAIFVGEGTFTVSPPLDRENGMLSQLTKSSEFVESFDRLVLRFTDDTDAEIRAAGTSAAAPPGGAAGALDDSQDHLRKKLKYNLSARILADLLGNEQRGLFLAFVHGKRYSGKMLFVIDPHGVDEVAPEEIALLTYDEMKSGIWAAFHCSKEYATGEATGTQQNAAIDMQHQKLDARIEKNGMLHGTAASTFTARSNGVRVVPFRLFPTLRVSKVTTSQGQPLAFIQEDKKEDADFWVILPKSLAANESFTVVSEYEGKEAVEDTGGGNYFPVARNDWYPARTFGDYATYDITLSIPKGMQMVATGSLVSEKTEGDRNVTVWRSDAPQAVAGFNFGQFKRQELKLEKQGYLVQAFANTKPPDVLTQLQLATDLDRGSTGHMRQSGVALGTLDTTALMKKPLAEATLSMSLFDAYFGPSSYKRVAMTQQTACNFGQSWPELVYMPICSFFDQTVQHQLGLDRDRGYWKTVAAHEVAHQWWGHTVGFNSYRDQWMSEGFAQFSASLFIQLIQKNQQEFIKFWRDQGETMTERNKEGHRPIDMGSLVTGYRLSNSKAGWDIYRRLIYPKGGYILHMIRMMMWDAKTGDERFQAMMKDFVQTYRNRPASTEDFKAMAEKHMTPGMNLTGKGNLDWFFNQFVYGTEVPRYKASASFRQASDGIHMELWVTQSNVSDTFAMLVPVYLEFSDGRVARIVQVRMLGNSTFGPTDIPLRGLTQPPRRAIVNYLQDVLAVD